MKVKFKMNVTWSDRSAIKGEVADLNDELAIKFINLDYVEEVKDDKHELKTGNSANNLGSKPHRSKKAAKG